jgi:hypothetical protein
MQKLVSIIAQDQAFERETIRAFVLLYRDEADLTERITSHAHI